MCQLNKVHQFQCTVVWYHSWECCKIYKACWLQAIWFPLCGGVWFQIDSEIDKSNQMGAPCTRKNKVKFWYFQTRGQKAYNTEQDRASSRHWWADRRWLLVNVSNWLRNFDPSTSILWTATDNVTEFRRKTSLSTQNTQLETQVLNLIRLQTSWPTGLFSDQWSPVPLVFKP